LSERLLLLSEKQMPKLLQNTVDANRDKIKRAALRLFTRQGFHGTTVRQIADKAGVSMGMLYTYYKTKEGIFVGLVQDMGRTMEDVRQKELLPLMRPLDPGSLTKLGLAIGRIVRDNLDYWRLMYIDVVEFRSKHFTHGFREVSYGVRTYTRALFQDSTVPFDKGVDPAFAYTSMYLQFFTYFLVEELFGAKGHLGVSNEKAIEQIVRIYTGKARTKHRK
jgi:TetR/AcrR family transcriptional regulator, acrAB operon repressor